MTAIPIDVTGLYWSGRDARWVVVVKQDDIFEHVRIHRANMLEDIDVVRAEAVAVLGRQFGIDAAVARRMIAAVAP